LIAAEQKMPAIDEMEVPTRIVNLPLSWDDESTQLAIQKYMRSVNLMRLGVRVILSLSAALMG
jgi:urea carboxylase